MKALKILIIGIYLIPFSLWALEKNFESVRSNLYHAKNHADRLEMEIIKFNKDISLINGQKLVFFEVVDTTLESLLANNTTLESFGTSFRTLDLSNVSSSAATASKGGNSVSLSLIDVPRAPPHRASPRPTTADCTARAPPASGRRKF